MNPVLRGDRRRGFASRLTQLAALTAGTMLASSVWAQGAAIDVNLPAQPLDQALRALSRQSGVQIVFATDQAEKRTAPAVSLPAPGCGPGAPAHRLSSSRCRPPRQRPLPRRRM